MQYKHVAEGFRCCLTRQCSRNKRTAIRCAATAFLRCNVGTALVAIHSNVAKVICAARRCGGKRVYKPYVAMGCIYISHFDWLHQSIFFCHGLHGKVAASALHNGVLWHVFYVPSGVLRRTTMQLCCTMMQHIPRCSVSHGVTARRVASCAARPLRGGRTFSPASRCSSSFLRTSLRKRPSPTQTSARPQRSG